MKLPILYARGENNKVLEWEIEVEGPNYRTITGQQGGQKTTSAWTTAKPKSAGKANATTAEEQAAKEAEAQWKKKKKSKGYFENMQDIDNLEFEEPMLANKFKEHKHKVSYPVMVDQKYNGMRQVTQAEGPKTRTGEVIHTAPHIFAGLDKQLLKMYPEIYLDGELYNHELRYQLNELVSIVRTTKNITPELLQRSSEIVRYYIYDGYGFDHPVTGQTITEETRCAERREALKALFKGAPPMFQVADYRWAKNEQEVEAIYKEYLDDGYEGAIVRTNTKYEHKRTNALLKMKPEDDDEFLILDIKEGEGNWAGKAKVITVQMIAGKQYDMNGTKIDGAGKSFDATLKGPMAQAAEILVKKADWIGRVVTLTYNGWTGKGTPNFAQLNPRNCFKGDR